jgi:formate hydrogenlyase subunit 3/multisubunit Na+/H+ antiporter MnhD subunit
MPDPALVLNAATTRGGVLLVLALVVPVASVLIAFVAGGRHVERVALATVPVGLMIAVATAITLRWTGGPLVYLLGGWTPPLGVALRADGLSVVMLGSTAVVISAVGMFARADFGTPAGLVEAREPFALWIL